MLVKPSQILLFNFDEQLQQPPAGTLPLPEAATEILAEVERDLNEPNKSPIIENSLPQLTEVIFSEHDKKPVELTNIEFSRGEIKPVFNGSGFASTSKAKLPVLIKSKRGRKSIEEMTASVELVDVPPDEILFQKRYYAIGKVAEMFKVNQSLLRLWENEFDILKPKKNGKGDRFFRPEDIKNIQLIHHLMREKKYTMEGAKDFIKNNKKIDETFAMIEALKKIKAFLLELRANL